ncbi:RecQ family ATP-dependent DNA helicase [Allokutzneria albata]|uniref:ATP-dependent DNA helicase RecQ n=1 Tax=Allokutzneria albata TaxID=211114 RepID=A0A1G9U9C5_ALLAB|nr:ATP-dependent DNA helicase RecQ [Allokutzneria albata]SDM56498.1 ATP-dependent DNA helicase RecQ [Allokutzneria albata]
MSELRRLAKEVFGWSRLREEQLRAMELVMAGHDVLAVLPTGAGKSAIYQVPALLHSGLTVVVSPLVALQRDQIEAIEASDAPKAVALNSAQRAAEHRGSWEALRAGTAKYLFLAPEQLAKPDVVRRLAELDVSLFVIDEAHCVSAWGHDFRPDYRRLAPVVDLLGRPRVIALTATAAPPVRRDIVERIGLRHHRAVIGGFDRPNLHLAVRRHDDDHRKRADVLAEVKRLAPACGLLYVATRKESEEYARQLAEAGVRIASYHAGMSAADRDRVQREFMDGELDVVAATSAFGMGIDKPDVRFVVHASITDSVDSYYQQIGRAGRDGEPATIVLFYRPGDAGVQKFLTTHPPRADAVEEVTDALGEHPEPIGLAQLKGEVDLPPATSTRVVNLLEESGAVHTTESGHITTEDSGLTAEQAATRATEFAGARQRAARSRLLMMSGYAETTGCRRQYLLGYFGEQLDEPCGNCDTCDAGTARHRSPDDCEFPRHSHVRHRDWGHGVVMSVEEDRLTVLFDEEGYRTLSLAAVREQDLLQSEGSTGS